MVLERVFSSQRTIVQTRGVLLTIYRNTFILNLQQCKIRVIIIQICSSIALFIVALNRCFRLKVIESVLKLSFFFALLLKCAYAFLIEYV